MVKKLALANQEQEKFLRSIWPGKITVVLKRTRLRQGYGGQRKIKLYGVDKKTIALRIPNYRLLLNLVKHTNLPITGTSANISGKPASGNIKEVLRQFENQKHQPDLIINAGNLPKSKPSKIIDLTKTPYKILRY